MVTNEYGIFFEQSVAPVHYRFCMFIVEILRYGNLSTKKKAKELKDPVTQLAGPYR